MHTVGQIKTKTKKRTLKPTNTTVIVVSYSDAKNMTEKIPIDLGLKSEVKVCVAMSAGKARYLQCEHISRG